jgi:hypothetical protein
LWDKRDYTYCKKSYNTYSVSLYCFFSWLYDFFLMFFFKIIFFLFYFLILRLLRI